MMRNMTLFHHYSYQAARDEKGGYYPHAAALWVKAALFSKLAINREWSLCRKIFCEKRQ
ncbi:ANR family transcriptional regulator [Salmonella enterica subsp. salamae]|nr:ANR family transcriptional regulator [Salmonella enterica subsp. salamae]